jgi:hypothetical protein
MADCHPPAPASLACLNETANEIAVYKTLKQILADPKAYSPEEIIARIATVAK